LVYSEEKSKIKPVHAKISKARMQTLTEKMPMQTLTEKYLPADRTSGLDAAWLGVELDTAANAKGGPCITSGRSRVATWVVPTNEELMIARHTLRVLDANHSKERELLCAAA
jgi:hypothetical protein